MELFSISVRIAYEFPEMPQLLYFSQFSTTPVMYTSQYQSSK